METTNVGLQIPRKPRRFSNIKELIETAARKDTSAWIGSWKFERRGEKWMQVVPSTGEAVGVIDPKSMSLKATGLRA